MKRVRPLTTIVVLVATVLGGGIWWLWTYFNRPSSADCAPLRELLSYNSTQIAALNAKTHDPEPGSYQTATEPSALDFRAWSDGLTDRAAKVTATDLKGPAAEMARTADLLVGARITFTTQSEHTAPGGEAPPVAMAVKVLNDEFESQVKQVSQLATTCRA